MEDDNKTREQLVIKLTELRSQNAAQKKSITVSISAELATEEARRYAESIVETVRKPLLVLDADLKIISANRNFYRTFKVTPGETIGSFIYDLGNKQWDIPKLRELLETILPQKATFDDYEVEHDFADIGRRVMLLNARQIQRVWGKERIILLAIEDITEQKRAEGKVQALNQELEQHITELQVVNEELKTFSYAVSHDLKAPLVTIGGFSRRLLEKYGDSLDEKGQQYLKMINTSSIRMEELIRGLLSFFSSGREAVNFSSLKMEKIVWEVFNQLKGMCPKRTIHLHVETMPDLKGDEAMITQVLVNLLSNAIKYTRPREIAVIYVGGWTEAERNVYYVKDNGIGFLIEDADKLFNAFERLQQTEEFEGTGLGLAIVKRVIERHGGLVWAEGKTGEGATFNFTIPK